MNNEMTTKDVLKDIYKALEDKKASDISIIEIRRISVVADYFVIASADNTRQTAALCYNVQDILGRKGIEVRQIEGRNTANWILMDYSHISVHNFEK